MVEDFKFACKRLRRSPGFAAVAVITLALAIGVNTAIFSIADAVLFRPLPYHDPDRVYVLRMLNRQTGVRFTQVPYQYLQILDQHHRGLGEIGMYSSGPNLIVDSNDGARRVPTLAVTANYFQVLGIIPARGRLFDSRDSTQPDRSAMLSYAAWQQQFSGDDKIVGRSVTFGTTTFDIVGVLPVGFVFPSSLAGKPEIVTVMAPVTFSAAGGAFHPIARLEPGITREQAQAEIEALVAPLKVENPRTADLIPVLDDVKPVLYPTGRPIMAFLLVAATFVLLIGCANLAIMLLARSKRNEHEIGVRSALGASRTRLVCPLLFEACLISLAGALLAILVTAITFNALLRQVPQIAYGDAPVGVDLRVVVFTLGLGLVASLAFSIVPAWRSGRLDALALIQGRYKHGTGQNGRLGRPMIAIQIALALTLVFGAVIASRAFLSVLRVPLGFTPDNIIKVHISPFGRTGAERQAFYVRAVETLARRGDVISVSAAGSLPLENSAPDEGVPTAGSNEMAAGIVHVLPGYFETTGIPLLHGRLLNWDDIRGDASASVISESAARKMFSGRDPLGATFTNGRGRQFIVVGLVADVRKSLERATVSPAYVIPGEATRLLTLIIRTRTRQEAMLATIRREVSALAPGAPITAEWWIDSISALNAYRSPRFQTLVLGAFAGLALTLAALGIFGVVTFSVATRTHEFGVRLALGAPPRSIIILTMKQMLVPVTVGLLIGLVMIWWASRLAEAQLFQVDTRAPVALAATVLIVIAVAFLTTYLPARRASRVDPMIVLRAE